MSGRFLPALITGFSGPPFTGLPAVHFSGLTFLAFSLTNHLTANSVAFSCWSRSTVVGVGVDLVSAGDGTAAPISRTFAIDNFGPEFIDCQADSSYNRLNNNPFGPQTLIEGTATTIPPINSHQGAGSSQGWHCIQFSANTGSNPATVAFAVDGNSAQTVITSDYSAGAFGSMNYGDSLRIPSLGVSSQVDLAEFWYAPGQFIDFTIAANCEKFFTPGNPPLAISLGSNGQNPTGTAPAVYLRGNAANFVNNLGTGGALTLSGAGISDASTNPYVGV